MADHHFRMAIRGGTCPRCEQHVVQALTHAGASEATASFRHGEARFRYDPNADLRRLVEAVKELSYRPGVVEEVGLSGSRDQRVA
ncbi:MAG: cation transporter [Chloroflexi bacterium]|nr:cation transporter [Chloroflexota bacterium]